MIIIKHIEHSKCFCYH